jgi:hypothetical protein
MGWPVRINFILQISLIGCCRKTLLILDKVGRIVAILVGRPDDPEWVYVIDDAANVLEEVQKLGANVDLFSDQTLSHRRGEFLAIPVGVSFGGGQTVKIITTFSMEWSHKFQNLGTRKSRP